MTAIIKKIEKKLPMAPRLLTFLRTDGLLILVTIIWGSTFLVVQETVKLVEPFTFLTLRFGIAALALAIIFHKRLINIRRKELITGTVIGLFLFIGYALQTEALQNTASSKVGFITALYVPVVPVLAVLMLRQWPTFGAVIGVILSFAGLVLLTVNEQFNLALGLGELLAIGSALAFALHIVSIGKFAPGADAINLAIVQISVTAVLSMLMIPAMGEPFVMPELAVWGSALFMGVVATAFALVVMNKVQQSVSSTRATLIYALEPVWAGLFGFYFAGETLAIAAAVGGVLIVLGMLAGEFRWSVVSRRLPVVSGRWSEIVTSSE